MFAKYFNKRIAELEKENAGLKWRNERLSDEYVSYVKENRIDYEGNGLAQINALGELRKCNDSNARYCEQMETIKSEHVLDAANYILKIDKLTQIIKGHKNA